MDVPVVYTAGTAEDAVYVVDFKNALNGATSDKLIDTPYSIPASVVINDVSYWNGNYTQTVGGSKYFTAEEFAYSLKDNCNITLTHNIDMMNAPLKFAFTMDCHSERAGKCFLSYSFRTGKNYGVKNPVLFY